MNKKETRNKNIKIAVVLLLLLIYLFIGVVARSAENILESPELKRETGLEVEDTGKVNENNFSFTLIGLETQYIEYGSEYFERGAIARFGNENISEQIRIDASNVDVKKVGTYKVVYEIEKDGDLKTLERIVVVRDTRKPSVFLMGSSVVTININDKYVEQGFVANDNYDGDITNKVIVDGNVNENKLGTYKIKYSVKDSSGNESSTVRTVNVVGGEYPVVKLEGMGIIYMEVYGKYEESGYIATDKIDGDITNKVKVSGVPDTTVLGTYDIVYEATNSRGFTISTIRTVVVRDTTKPQISLIGNQEVVVELFSEYVELGVNVTDNYDKDLVNRVVVTGEVNVNEVGVYYLTYTVTDSSVNLNQIQRKVIVTNNIPIPVISIELTKIDITIQKGSKYNILEGVTANDKYDGDISSKITYTSSPEFNKDVEGTYIITYSVTNSFGKTATNTNTVIVQDNMPISLINKVKASVVTSGDGVYYTNDPDKIQKDNNDNLIVSEQYYFRGLNPNNWIEFGQVSETNTTPLLWRILYLSDEGIKIIYEGTKQSNNVAPPEDGRLNVGDSKVATWNPTNNNYWESPVFLKTFLNDWYENQLYIAGREKYVKPINWGIGLVRDNNPNDLKYFVHNERKDITIQENIVYPGVTPNKTAVGLINPSYFIMTSSNPNSNESFADVNDTSLEAGVNNFLRKTEYVFWTNNAYNGNGGRAWHVGAVGRVSYSFTTNAYGIRPVINLKEDILYKSGVGTLSDPYVIKVE